ncbi:unnamed protein product [Euphydryas editha]|uniref:TIL domain-containing protein n=1 Tax=Euphydryas editha TaxID=104508 RepID=A0AAU9TF68_EUPED|nr:unnamed protein product [Euphydryas editha]
MARELVFVFATLIFASVIVSTPVDGASQCSDNEVFKQCTPSCIKSCRTLTDPDFCQVSITTCTTPQCVCRDGYLRNDDGVCVLIEQC